MGFNAGTNGADGGTQPVLLGDQHGHHLVPAGSQRVEDLGLGVLEGAHLRTDGVGEMGQAPRVQSVGLGQRSGGLGEVPDLAWVDHHRQRRSAAAARAATKGNSKPPVASNNTKAGSRSTIWGISPSIPVWS